MNVACMWYHFLISMMLLFFSIGTLIAGIFTIYFGTGKSRNIGIILIIIGIIFILFFSWCAWLIPFLGTPPISLCGCIVEALSAVIGAIIGLIISIGIFLLIIMKI